MRWRNGYQEEQSGQIYLVCSKGSIKRQGVSLIALRCILSDQNHYMNKLQRWSKCKKHDIFKFLIAIHKMASLLSCQTAMVVELLISLSAGIVTFYFRTK